MLFSPKAAILATSLVALLGVGTLAQNRTTTVGAKPARATGETIVIAGTLDFVQKSDVSALREGVIKKMEFQVGKLVQEGQQIGQLEDKLAELAVAKAKLAAGNVGAIEKGKAQLGLAKAEAARFQRLAARGAGFASTSELEKAEAEVVMGYALVKEATENQNIAKQELASAEQVLKEHKILAPITGYMTEQMKYAGESVSAREPVVRIVRLDKLRFIGWVPLESGVRIKEGDLVDVKPTIEGSDLAIEQKRFRGKVTSVSREINTVRTTELQVLAEIENPPDPDHPELELRLGMKGDMTIYLNGAVPKVARSN